MRGHIRKRGDPGTWSITYDLGVQPAQRCKLCNRRFWIERRPLEQCPKCGGELEETKERRQKTEGGFKRRKGDDGAEAALNKVLESMSQGTYVARSKLTLGEYLRDMWLPSLQNGNLRPTTLASYEIHVTHHLTPHLGSMPLQRLNRDVIGAHYAWLLKEGRVPKKPRDFEARAKLKAEAAANGKPKRRRKKKTTEAEKPAPVVVTSLSPATVRRVHATLHRAMRDAVRSHLLPLNPADDVDLPKDTTHDRTLHAWDSEQLKTFLTSLDGDRLRPLWLLYATTGARRGELLGLTREDVDLKASTITIRRALVPVGYTVIASEPKTASGRRTISLPLAVAGVLKRHLATQKEEKMQHRDIWAAERADGLRDLDLIFTREDGAELHPDRVSKLFEKAVTKSKMPRISLHGLRHTFATIALIESHQPVSVVSQRLGHANTSITLDFYSHAMPRHDEEAAAAVAALVVPEGF
jgi:integrase